MGTCKTDIISMLIWSIFVYTDERWLPLSWADVVCQLNDVI